MNATDRSGFVSFKMVLLVLGIAGAGFALLGPVRTWGMRQLDANRDRHLEFDRRVKAQRHVAIRPELAQAGIHIEEASAPLDSSHGTSDRDLASEPRASLPARVARWWRNLWGTPEPLQPQIPVMRDSLGLLPGERMILPNGRMVEYDTTTFRYHPPEAGR